jgi:very-short-patch-repair endonuclease
MAERWKGRRGAGRLGAVFEGGPPARTRSEAEERFLGLVRQARVNVTIAGYEVDFYWPDARLGVEVDGAAFHGSPLAIERDRRRDARLAAAGIRVMRVTWRQLTREREALLVQLGRALAVGGSGRP